MKANIAESKIAQVHTMDNMQAKQTWLPLPMIRTLAMHSCPILSQPAALSKVAASPGLGSTQLAW